jgi:hypothetical protein
MRNPREEKSKIDLLKPIDNTVILDKTDCLGHLYDPKNKECSICQEQAYCANLYARDVQKKIESTEREQGPFLDQVDFQSINWEKLEIIARQYEVGNDPLSFNELITEIKALTKCADDVAVTEFIRRNLPKTNLILEAGYVKGKDKNN